MQDDDAGEADAQTEGRMMLDRLPKPPDRRARRPHRWRRYRQRVRAHRMVPDMPDIGADELGVGPQLPGPTLSAFAQTRHLAEHDSKAAFASSLPFDSRFCCGAQRRFPTRM
jgi:hypothetical protein